MNKLFFGLFVSAVCAGCLSSAPKAPTYWLVESRFAEADRAAQPKFGSVRLAPLVVRAPSDTANFVVLRADYTVAYDGRNAFAVKPPVMLRNAAEDIAAGSGLFAAVVPSASAAAAELSLEVTVDRFAFDCRQPGRRDATAAVSVCLLKGREPVAYAAGEAAVSASGGDYSQAFSQAFTQALVSALKKL